MPDCRLPSPIKSSFVLVVLAAAGLGLGACAASTEPKPDSPAHHTVDGFRNLYIEDPNKTLFHFLAMKHFGEAQWADHAARAAEVPVRPLDPKTLEPKPAGLRISWLGHSTFLIQWQAVNILTDPVFGNRASPLSFAGPTRYIRHVIEYRKLPKIDYVVISHNHYDHLDKAAVEILGSTPIYIVPLKLKAWFMQNGVAADRVREMDWWDTAQFADAKFTAQPSQHWSARSFFDRRKTLWASWRIGLNGTSLWFAGDTGYNDKQFREIGETSGPVDVALIPIGGYLPRSFMALYHVNPDEAVRMHKDVKAKLSIGMHWGTFPLTAEGPGDPVIELARQRRRHGIDDNTFRTMAAGETIHLNP